MVLRVFTLESFTFVLLPIIVDCLLTSNGKGLFFLVKHIFFYHFLCVWTWSIPVYTPNGSHGSFLYGYGSIPIDTIFRGMNIHLPAILMFTRGTRFWHTAIYLPDFMGDSNNPDRLMVTIPFRWWRFALSMAERLRRSAPWAAQIRRSSRNLRCIWIRMEAIEQLGWARAELMEFASNIWYMEFTLW